MKSDQTVLTNANNVTYLSPLEVVAERIFRDGPYKHEPAKRRLRGVLNGKWVFDTLDAEFVWEHPYCQLVSHIILPVTERITTDSC